MYRIKETRETTSTSLKRFFSTTSYYTESASQKKNEVHFFTLLGDEAKCFWQTLRSFPEKTLKVILDKKRQDISKFKFDHLVYNSTKEQFRIFRRHSGTFFQVHYQSDIRTNFPLQVTQKQTWKRMTHSSRGASNINKASCEQRLTGPPTGFRYTTGSTQKEQKRAKKR